MVKHTAASPGDALRTMRIIGLALGGGVTLFAVVTWFLHRADPPPGGGDPWMFYLWIAIATSATAASMIVWRGTVVPWLERSEAGGDWRERAARIQPGLIICWALVEGAALVGVVVYFLYGSVLPGMIGVFMMWTTLALTWPQSEWLAEGQAANR